MELLFNGLSGSYKSKSQKIRILTEDWVKNEIFCPSCGKNLEGYENNRPVADFYCKKCTEDFELKSKLGKFGKKISAGAYSKMIERLNSKEKPNFFFMGYLDSLHVNDFFVVPKHFFVPVIIEKRKPLSGSAKRAGWVGSNILFHKIPKAGHVFYVKDGKEISKSNVLEEWKKTLFLRSIKNTDAKGWILDVMNCIDALNKKEFELAEIYNFEDELKKTHPENNNIQAKIRQQLQLLRDKGYLSFISPGRYKLN